MHVLIDKICLEIKLFFFNWLKILWLGSRNGYLNHSLSFCVEKAMKEYTSSVSFEQQLKFLFGFSRKDAIKVELSTSRPLALNWGSKLTRDSSKSIPPFIDWIQQHGLCENKWVQKCNNLNRFYQVQRLVWFFTYR